VYDYTTGFDEGYTLDNRELLAAMTAMAIKMGLEIKHLENSDYFVIIASSWHPLLLIENAAN